MGTKETSCCKCGPFFCKKTERKTFCENFCGIKSCKIDNSILCLNATASLLHLVLFIILIIVRFGFFSDLKLNSKDLMQSITVWNKFNSSNKTCAGVPTCFTTAEDEFLISTKQIKSGSLTLEFLILSFSALSFIFQGIRPFIGIVVKGTPKGTPNIYNDYLDEVATRINWLRWIEYSFSATCMILAIGFVVDPNIEFSTVLLTSTSTAATQLCGLVGELMLEMNPFAKKNANTQELKSEANLLPAWVIHFTGWILQIGVFASIFNAYTQSVAYADEHDAVPPPWFVGLIVWGEAVLFGSFGLTQLFDFLDRSGVSCGCTKGVRFEYVFIGLSLTAKFFLSITVAANLWVTPDS